MSLFNMFDRKIKECECCYCEVDDSNYTLYRENKEDVWKSSKYCKTCVAHLLITGWETYLKHVKDADCAAALRRVIKNGPPINLRDSLAFPCKGDNEVDAFYYDGEIQSAKLAGSLVSDEREKFWNQQRQILQLMEEIEAKSSTTPATPATSVDALVDAPTTPPVDISRD